MNAISEARRARNLSLEDIARTTCIGLRYVRAIDEGRLADLPTGLYGRAWVRAVAAVVHVEGAALDEILAPLTPAPDPLPALEEVRAARAAAQPRSGEWGGQVAAVLDAVMLLALNGVMVALAAEACGVTPRHVVTMTPVPLFVLCATTWLVYSFCWRVSAGARRDSSCAACRPRATRHRSRSRPSSSGRSPTGRASTRSDGARRGGSAGTRADPRRGEPARRAHGRRSGAAVPGMTRRARTVTPRLSTRISSSRRSARRRTGGSATSMM